MGSRAYTTPGSTPRNSSPSERYILSPTFRRTSTPSPNPAPTSAVYPAVMSTRVLTPIDRSMRFNHDREGWVATTSGFTKTRAGSGGGAHAAGCEGAGHAGAGSHLGGGAGGGLGGM